MNSTVCPTSFDSENKEIDVTRKLIATSHNANCCDGLRRCSFSSFRHKAAAAVTAFIIILMVNVWLHGIESYDNKEAVDDTRCLNSTGSSLYDAGSYGSVVGTLIEACDCVPKAISTVYFEVMPSASFFDLKCALYQLTSFFLLDSFQPISIALSAMAVATLTRLVLVLVKYSRLMYFDFSNEDTSSGGFEAISLVAAILNTALAIWSTWHYLATRELIPRGGRRCWVSYGTCH